MKILAPTLRTGKVSPSYSIPASVPLLTLELTISPSCYCYLFNCAWRWLSTDRSKKNGLKSEKGDSYNNDDYVELQWRWEERVEGILLKSSVQPLAKTDTLTAVSNLASIANIWLTEWSRGQTYQQVSKNRGKQAAKFKRLHWLPNDNRKWFEKSLCVNISASSLIFF